MTKLLRFVLTEDHLKLLRRANVCWQEYETGAPGIDGKRPYGNSFVAGDVCEILEWPVDDDEGPTDEQREKAMAIHDETLYALQITLTTGEMAPGEFTRANTWSSPWTRVAL